MPARASGPAPSRYMVAGGDTLYSIAWAYGLDYRSVAGWNNIPAPYTIYPGQELKLRAPTSTTAARPSSTGARTSTPPRSSTAPRQTKPTPHHVVTSADTRWQWPADGTLLARFSADDPSGKGIDIGGRRGQRVLAARGGSVVYSGSGLLGYGKLIIIKHDDTYLSAYAHNDRIRVHENDIVNVGQHIADMGDSGSDRVMLHFEIRRDGKPVDPLRYLPKRAN
ncbi:MAG: hypothetical protein AMJ69_07040 [Gammaproteobacteria bacterium SG8_47]|nr:MAG: hypothetical protein AMJ69_07040 [Gammaproteobacteria bacterium SG8_47]